MAWSAMAPTVPPDVQAMLDDQNARWAQYYASNPSQARPTYNTFDWDSLVPGEMLFTEGYQPVQTQITGSNRLPFRWEGSNDSLRSAYQQTYDSYWNSQPASSNSVQYASWTGPEVRALYDSTGDVSPDYWQDNNVNSLYETDLDSFYSPPQQQQQQLQEEQEQPRGLANVINSMA